MSYSIKTWGRRSAREADKSWQSLLNCAQKKYARPSGRARNGAAVCSGRQPLRFEIRSNLNIYRALSRMDKFNF